MKESIDTRVSPKGVALKIAAVNTAILRAPGPDVYDATHRLGDRSLLLVSVHASDGAVGFGEAECWGQPEIVAAIIEHKIAPLLSHAEGSDPEAVWSYLMARAAPAGHKGYGLAAISGVDIALWDLAGKESNRPLFQLLGADSGTVDAYASGGFYAVGKSAADLAAECVSYVDQGYRGVKIKVARNPIGVVGAVGTTGAVGGAGAGIAAADGAGAPDGAEAPNSSGARDAPTGEGAPVGVDAPVGVGAPTGRAPTTRVSLAEDVERVAAVREAIGPGIQLMVDANRSWTEKTAIEMGREFEQLDVTFLEEPVSPDEIEVSASVARNLDLAIAGYESQTDYHNLQRIIDQRAVDVLQADAIRSGGITAILHLGERARRAGISFMPHNFSSVLSLAANLHPLCAMDNGGAMEIPMLAGRFHRELATAGPEIADGRVTASERPGLGVELNRENIDT